MVCPLDGRRVLTYSDLGSTFADPDGREPRRTIELHLTGHIERFAWSFDGIKFSDAEPLRFTYGERLRLVLVNDTMMTHPIHLHGMSDSASGLFQNQKRRPLTRCQPPASPSRARTASPVPNNLRCHTTPALGASSRRIS